MKTTLLRILKWVAIVLALAAVGIQFVRPARTNPPLEPAQTLEAHTQMTPEVAKIFERSCNDCHSNRTTWPWYTNVAPVSWWTIDHVTHGRSHLNYSEWGKLERPDQEKSLQEICDEVLDGKMPLPSYLPMHPQARLSEQDKKVLCDWTEAERQRMAAQPR
ncbi:MAG: heme-binding domain-containing protein [Pyrinomonadaceae bacterium]